MVITLRQKLLALCSASVLCLAACGGGGSSSDTPTTVAPPATPPTTTSDPVTYLTVQGEITGFGSRFATAALYLPSFEDGALVWERMPRFYMILSLFVGVCLLLAVNVELLLRDFVTLHGGGER